MAPTDQPPFHVLIIGGSITGLSLALMLQASGIAFTVLEAHADIAPQVGASIGFQPYGCRLLDQLGCFEALRAAIPPLDHWQARDARGRVFVQHRGWGAGVTERHGYPVMFMDRQKILQVFYDHIADKSRVLVNKRVISIQDPDEGPVSVTTADGSTFSGDIVVGADGAHSVVREQMWALADQHNPGYFPQSDKTEMSCDYSCLFGICAPSPGIKPGDCHVIFRQGSSYLIVCGPGGRVYFFLFFHNGATSRPPRIPRYAASDATRIATAHFEDPITEDLRFGDLYRKVISSSATALQEMVLRKWHYRRVIVLGDAAHKIHPVAGHGGNAAIESSATLVNILTAALHNRQTQTPLTTHEITTIFSTVQRQRLARVTALMHDARTEQQLHALETPFLRFAAAYVLPTYDGEPILQMLSKPLPAGVRLHNLPLPHREKLIPYDDELLRVPRPRSLVVNSAIASVFLGLSALAVYAMHIRPQVDGTSALMSSTIQTGVFPNGTPLEKPTTGVHALDELLNFLITAFTPATARWDAAHTLLTIYFLVVLLLPLNTIWAVEAHRARHAWSLVSFTTLWTTAYQLLGAAVIAPLFYLAHLWAANPPAHWWPTTRRVPLHTARALLPALLTGYLLPTLLLYLPYTSPVARTRAIVFWQASPAYINLLALPLGMLYRRSRSSFNLAVQPAAVALVADVPHLRRLYRTVFTLSALCHILILTFSLLSPNPSLSPSHVFFPTPDPSPDLIHGLARLWAADFHICAAASAAWCVASVWDVRRVGRAEVRMGRVVAGVLGGCVLVGPGAVMAAVWCWREGRLVGCPQRGGEGEEKEKKA